MTTEIDLEGSVLRLASDLKASAASTSSDFLRAVAKHLLSKFPAEAFEDAFDKERKVVGTATEASLEGEQLSDCSDTERGPSFYEDAATSAASSDDDGARPVVLFEMRSSGGDGGSGTGGRSPSGSSSQVKERNLSSEKEHGPSCRCSVCRRKRHSIFIGPSS